MLSTVRGHCNKIFQSLKWFWLSHFDPSPKSFVPKNSFSFSIVHLYSTQPLLNKNYSVIALNWSTTMHTIAILKIFCVLPMALAKTIKELVNVLLKGVDLIDHTSIFLLRIINHCVILLLCILSCSWSINLYRIFRQGRQMLYWAIECL